MNPLVRGILFVNSVVLALLAAVAFLYPSARALVDFQDPALRQPGIPQKAWRIYRSLTPRYAAWARTRISDETPENHSTTKVSGAERALFGAALYLWGLENLQTAWDAGDHGGGVEPRLYAKTAIVAASELILDAKNASWAKRAWGDDYLHRQDVSYRTLIIASLTSRERLLRDGVHTDILRDQVESLSRELDESRSGLLENEPGKCYPGDVIAAIASIRRADVVLGTDHSAFASRALRGFIGTQATRMGLPPYRAEASNGRPLAEARGGAGAYCCLSAPELWPAEAKRWFQLYDQRFWQERFTAAGFRELANGAPNGDWSLDAKVGPIAAGYGLAANGFGVGAARKNGRFDRAYPLEAEMLALAWELPGGGLAAPRLLSNWSDAPMLGEAAILYMLTVQPEKGFPLRAGGSAPLLAYLVTIGALVIGLLMVMESIWRFRTARLEPEREYPEPALQAAIWVCLWLGALAAQWSAYRWVGFVLLAISLLLPQAKKHPRDQGNKPEDLPARSLPAE